MSGEDVIIRSIMVAPAADAPSKVKKEARDRGWRSDKESDSKEKILIESIQLFPGGTIWRGVEECEEGNGAWNVISKRGGNEQCR